MFSNEPRVRFEKNQLAEVICQLRFPEILSIEVNIPAAFQDKIRGEFPNYFVRKETPAPRMVGAPGNMQMQQQAPNNNYYFVSEDRTWRVNLTSKFISLSCSAYTTWEEFAQKLDGPLAAFIQIYNPAYFERVGLRYVNAFSRQELDLKGVPFRDLIAPQYLGILACPEIAETSTSRNSYDVDFRLNGNASARIHAGPGLLQKGGKPKDNEVKFILDLDVSINGSTPIHLSASALDSLHGQADKLFRGAITEELTDALCPKERL